MIGDRRPNRLSKEKSPYLLEHAFNPVDWYPWGDEAFDKARSEQKPIFLSVGYSTCHWCHVLRDESFEDDSIAEYMNQNFVSIKVDREERPDVDEVYMKAVISMTGQGGWPLSVFLTPDLSAFYGGTYFPPAPRYGMPSFRQLLEFVADLWKTRRQDVQRGAKDLTSRLREEYRLERGGVLSEGLLDHCYASLVSRFDPEYGGFGDAPKFPMPGNMSFLLRYFTRMGKELALRAVKKTLDAMTAGGIHDHLAGGFHRYSTDRKWLVPHFEKMLYDNALLARTFCEAYQVTQDPALSTTARSTLDWMIREMASADGGFFSAQDADTADGEGFYYTWTRPEVVSLLGEEGELFCHAYGLTNEGNFEAGRSVLHLAATLEAVADRFKVSASRVESSLTAARQQLLTARSKRTKPAIDDKVLTAWNGLAISALAYAYRALGEEKYLSAAQRTASFILERLVVGRDLFRRYREGAIAVPATLEDYALLALGLVDLYESDFQARWLERAVGLARAMVELFWDKNEGGFVQSRLSDSPPIIVKEGYDGPIPSGNSTAALGLTMLAELTGDDEFRRIAGETLKAFARSMDAEPSAHTAMLSALNFQYGPPCEVVIATEKLDGEAMGVIREVHSRFMPTSVLALVCNGDPARTLVTPLTEGKKPVDGRTTVYICENFACKRPVNDISALRTELDRLATPRVRVA